MAKTNFVYGTLVAAAFLNKIFKDFSATGSRHDGQDEDGHLPKINLADDYMTVKQEVTGVLPADKIGHLSGSVVVKITTSYVTAEQQVTAYYQVDGQIAMLRIPEMFGTSNSTGCKLTLVSPPAAMLPAYAQKIPVPVWNNGKMMIGYVEVQSGSDWEMASPVDGNDNAVLAAGFTASGYKGINTTSIAYWI